VSTRWRAAPPRAVLIERADVKRARRSRGRGIVWYGVGCVFVLALVGLAVGSLIAGRGSTAAADLGLAFRLAALLTGPLLRRGRQLQARRAEDVLAGAEYPPIVYLRTFASDRMAVLPVWRSRRRWRPLRCAATFGVAASYEEVLARAERAAVLDDG